MNPLTLIGVACVLLRLLFLLAGTTATWHDGYRAARADQIRPTATRLAER